MIKQNIFCSFFCKKNTFFPMFSVLRRMIVHNCLINCAVVFKINSRYDVVLEIFLRNVKIYFGDG